MVADMNKNKPAPVVQKPMKRAVSRRVMQDFKRNGNNGKTFFERLGL
jgi:hypothetical protein